MPHMETMCWEWTASLHNGYGRISLPGGRSTVDAHVASWLIHHGSYHRSLSVLHHCDNKRCIRIEHLYLGTTSDNARDAIDRGLFNADWRGDLTHCKQGHPLSGDNLRIESQRDGTVGSMRVCKACQRERSRQYREKKASR
jgi:hypothetical protein